MTTRIHRVSRDRPGFTRRRQGRGFAYLDRRGRTIADPHVLARIRTLSIPPAWTDVWICPDPNGHLQATGVDDAGRRQYLYHEAWRARQDRAKHARVERIAERLPALRARVARDLRADGYPRSRVLACAVRLLDRGPFRIGSEAYATANGSFGLATMRKEHVSIANGTATFDFVGKSGKRHRMAISDRGVVPILRGLRRRDDGRELLAWRDGNGWRDVRSEDINGYLRDVVGEDVTAKDFRTWRATVLCAALLAEHAGAASRRRTVTAVVREVAEHLGNTPAVCRASYIDPRVIDRFLDREETIDVTWHVDGRPERVPPRVERSVLRLLRGE
ncbi:MAG TPA: DNA topoisomerase IB [Actinomycetota bacterium]